MKPHIHVFDNAHLLQNMVESVEGVSILSSQIDAFSVHLKNEFSLKNYALNNAINNKILDCLSDFNIVEQSENWSKQLIIKVLIHNQLNPNSYIGHWILSSFIHDIALFYRVALVKDLVIKKVNNIEINQYSVPYIEPRIASSVIFFTESLLQRFIGALINKAFEWNEVL